MKELNIAAKVENIEVVTDFINEQLEELGCPMRYRIQFDVAVDELFGNIARYAYDGKEGEAIIRFDHALSPLSVSVTFIDSGSPFDPLQSEDPDITLPAEERRIGGLGIFVVKKTMDQMDYRYEDGKNILTIKKVIG